MVAAVFLDHSGTTWQSQFHILSCPFKPLVSIPMGKQADSIGHTYIVGSITPQAVVIGSSNKSKNETTKKSQYKSERGHWLHTFSKNWSLSLLNQNMNQRKNFPAKSLSIVRIPATSRDRKFWKLYSLSKSEWKYLKKWSCVQLSAVIELMRFAPRCSYPVARW